jgi:hypothetical protein
LLHLVLLAAVSVLSPSRPVTTINPAKLERLTAAGLKADDPQLSAHLQALAGSRRSALQLKPAPTFAPHATPATLTLTKIPFTSAVALRPAAQTGPIPVVTSLAFAGGLITIQGSNLMTGYGGTPTITPNLTISGCTPQPLNLWTAFGESPTQLRYLGPPVPKSEPARLSVTVGGVTSPPINISYPASPPPQSPEGVGVYVDYLSPYYQTDLLGQTTASFATTGSHISTDFSGPTITGTDTLGIGTYVVNGWTATAQISSVESYMDGPGENGSNDVFRSATISQQPAGGRLETKVAWSIQGGESISYTINWVFSKGPDFTRMVTTMPKQTTCSDEQ